MSNTDRSEDEYDDTTLKQEEELPAVALTATMAKLNDRGANGNSQQDTNAGANNN
jgi:hypothetical protein